MRIPKMIKVYQIKSDAILTMTDSTACELIWKILQLPVKMIAEDDGYMEGGFTLHEIKNQDELENIRNDDIKF
jgi:hypothetical protein